MKRRMGWAIQLAVGMVLGCALYAFCQTIHVETSARAEASLQDVNADAQNAEIVEQLKQINAHVARIDTLLYSGKLRVINIINNP